MDWLTRCCCDQVMAHAEGRASLVFGLYAAMAEPRSLRRLATQLVELGSPVSVQTLKRWSSRFGWQAQLQEIDRQATEQQVRRLAAESFAMLGRHAELARGMQAAGGQGLKGLLQDADRVSALSAADIVRLVELGLKAEASATRQAADRRELALSLSNLLVHEVVDTFQAVNELPEPELRARIFGERLDRVLDGFMALEA